MKDTTRNILSGVLMFVGALLFGMGVWSFIKPTPTAPACVSTEGFASVMGTRFKHGIITELTGPPLERAKKLLQRYRGVPEAELFSITSIILFRPSVESDVVFISYLHDGCITNIAIDDWNEVSQFKDSVQ